MLKREFDFTEAMGILDEECMFPRTRDLTLANKLKDHLRRNDFFKSERDKKFRIGRRL